MKPSDMVQVESVNHHDCRFTHRSYVTGERYVIPRDKAEARVKSRLVKIVRLADDQTAAKRVGNAPENKQVGPSPEDKTLVANSRKELAQLCEGMGLQFKGNANKQKLIDLITADRQRMADAAKEAALDADAVKGGAVKE